MEAHKPSDKPEGQPQVGAPEINGETPVEGQTRPDMPDSADPSDAPVMGGLREDLLRDEIITQAEYDALIAG